jgi:hypothetical protein
MFISAVLVAFDADGIPFTGAEFARTDPEPHLKGGKARPKVVLR